MILRYSLSLLKKNFLITCLMVMNLFIGVLMPIGLYSYKNTINDIFQKGGQAIIGGDLKVSSRIKPREESLKGIDEFLADQIVSKSELKSLFSMGSVNGKVGMLNLVTVKGDYPYYGTILTSKGHTISSLKDFELMVRPEVLLKFGLGIGDSIDIGGQNFRIVDTVVKDVNEGMQIAQMAPKVYVSEQSVVDAGLISTGSTIFYSYIYKLKTELVEDRYVTLKDKILDTNIRFTRAAGANDMFSRSLNIVFDFSQIIFLCGILISVSAFAFIYRYFLKKESANILTYSTLGVGRRSIYGIYLLHGIYCLLTTFILAYLFSYMISPFVGELLAKYSSVSLGDFTLLIPFKFLGILSVFLLSVIITFCYSTIEQRRIGFSYYIIPVLSLILLVYYQTNSIIIAPAIVGLLLLLLLIFYYLLPLVLKPFLAIKNTFFNMAVLSLIRNRTTTISKFYILFVTFFVLNLIPTIFMSISSDIEVGKTSRPDYFIFDIQEDQFEPLQKYLKENGIEHSTVSPMIRGRLTSINGKEVKADASESSSFEGQQRNRALNRGVNISYENTLNSAERVVKGNYFKDSSPEDGVNEVSLETRYAKRIGVKVGDKISFEIFDINFDVIVTSIRSVKWTSFLPNFFIVFENGLLNDAPKTFLTTLSNVKNYNDIVKLVNEFKSLSIVDIKEMTFQAQKFLSIVEVIIVNMVLVFLVISALSFVSLTFFSIKITQAENQLLKYLGVGFSELRSMRVTEFTLLSFLSIFLAIAIAFIIGFIVVDIFLGITFTYVPLLLLLNLIPFLGIFFYNKRFLSY